MTVDIKIGNHVHINIDSTIGHDSILEDFVTNKKLKEIGLIVKDEFGLTLKDFELTAGEDFNIEDNYNDDFIEVDKKIIKHLSAKNKKGLILFSS